MEIKISYLDQKTLKNGDDKSPVKMSASLDEDLTGKSFKEPCSNQFWYGLFDHETLDWKQWLSPLDYHKTPKLELKKRPSNQKIDYQSMLAFGKHLPMLVIQLHLKSAE